MKSPRFAQMCCVYRGGGGVIAWNTARTPVQRIRDVQESSSLY